MQEKRVPVLDLEVMELEKGRKPGGCSTSSSTSNLCTCPCHIITARDSESRG